MRKLVLLCFLFPIAVSAQQRWHINLFGGVSNYQGDLQDKPITLDQSNGAFGAGVKYDLTNYISVRAGFNYGRIEADDKRNKEILQRRNLSFQSKIFEVNLLGEYNIFDLSDRRFTPYVFGGVALFHFNPYAYDTLGNKHYLQPLSTEGQGLSIYPDKKPYKLTQFAIPFGAGFKFRISDNAVIGYEFGLRKTFFDYLDDVSTTYADPNILAAERGPIALAMSYRGDEVKIGDPNYPAEGSIRGGSKYKDWYYFTGLTLSIGIGNNVSGIFGGRKGQLGCPKVL